MSDEPFFCNPRIMINRSYDLKEDSAGQLEAVEICNINALPFDKFIIPPYQRPYKWTTKHVNQLISDLLTFSTQRHYRLGTLVLHNNEIVDGQQRIITLALLIRVMCDVLKGEKIKAYAKIIEKISTFSKQVSFSNRHTLHNVVENVHTIERRMGSFDLPLFDFLLTRCEFVVVRLGSISEAFQFFDSQNARGKDLAPHDLLKAYHLREISSLTAEDSQNIDEWQNQSTASLRGLFLTLFRAKRWSHRKEARVFTKDHTDVFKGISLNDEKRYPFYQKEIIAHQFTEMYNHDPVRMIDQHAISYPFNLNDQIVNGGRFFDMIRHYMKLHERIRRYRSTLPEGDVAQDILNLIATYDGAERTGDRYVSSMFYTLLLYYVDRFGEEELDKVVPQFFIWAYKLRLRLTSVRLASMDNHASSAESMFVHVCEARAPYDLININIEGESSVRCSRCKEVKEKFKTYNKLYVND